MLSLAMFDDTEGMKGNRAQPELPMSQWAVARNSSTAGDVNRTSFLCGDLIHKHD